MTDTTIAPALPCINGCIRKGTEDTAGPEPLVAKRGMFCLRCFGKAERALRAVPDLVEHVVSNFPGTITKVSDDVRVSGTSERSLGAFSEQAWVDADAIYSALAVYSAHWATAMAISPPAPARRSWRDEHGYVLGLPASISPADARQTAGVMSDWLLMHLPQIFTFDQASVNEFIEALAPIGSIAARWPMVERPRTSPMPHVQLSICNGQIKVWPEGLPGTEVYAVCEKCGYQFELDEYEEAVHAYLVDQQETKRARQAAAARATREQNSAANVQKRLLAKYGQIVGHAS